MRVPISELAQHLKQRLHSFYFIYGEEAFLCMEAAEQIRSQAKCQGYTEHERYEITSHLDWERVKASLNALTLFSDKRLIECRFREDRIGKTAGQSLLEVASTLPADIVFLCSAGKLDASLKKSAWFVALERQGVMLCASPLAGGAFVQWLRDRLRSLSLTLSEEIFSALVERTEGNLLAAAQAIEKLSLYFSHSSDLPYSEEDIHQLISVDTRFSVFDLVTALLMGSIPRTKQIFFSLKQEGIEPLLISWAITREVRTIIPLAGILEAGGSLAQGFREHQVWQHKVKSIGIFLNRVTLPFLYQCLTQAKQLDDLLKGQRPGDAWDELYALCLMLARGSYAWADRP